MKKEEERCVTLKKGKEKPILNRHHWIFSGAVEKMPSVDPGEILPVFSYDGRRLGEAYFNKRCSIVGRMLSFGSTSAREGLQQHLQQAIEMRQRFFDSKQTSAFRLINGEGDAIPGLIVDKYGDLLVIQVATAGIEKLKGEIIEMLCSQFPDCKTIYEKSRLPTRKEEGLKEFEGLLFGNPLERVEVLENGLRFFVAIPESQKTGFFLDQREMRCLIGELSAGKRVLNCFSYTGGFSVYAAKGRAEQVDSVDISAKAIELAQENFALNGLKKEAHQFYSADVFEFLRQKELNYDIIILDPPAFAKKKEDVVAACRGYKDLNRQALQKMPKGSLLLTCSCSYHVDERLFQTVVFQAAAEAHRSAKIIGRHRQAMDHPVNLYHPEGEYLKSLLLYVE